MKHIISLGAGVQSSTMTLMAAAGEIMPMPDCAIFADTQAEPKKVYEWLDWLERQLPFPVHRVTAGNLEADMLKSAALGKRIANPPFFTGISNLKRKDYMPVPAFTLSEQRSGQLRRQCTREYKIEPMNKFLRQYIGLAKGERAREVRVTRWIGISMDEAHRCKLSTEPWSINRHPLIELRMNRLDCLAWMERNGYPRPSKSACYFCPYHDDALWRDMKLNAPDEFARAIALDKAIRHGTIKGVKAPVFLHRSCKPLDEIDLRSAEDAGQARLFDEHGFAVECEGMCGV